MCNHRIMKDEGVVCGWLVNEINHCVLSVCINHPHTQLLMTLRRKISLFCSKEIPIMNGMISVQILVCLWSEVITPNLEENT